MGMFSQLAQGVDWSSLGSMLLRVAAVLLCLVVHEVSHGLAACYLGDPTAKQSNRLSLNPLHHLDPVGAVCMLVGGVGWAKPVGINAANFRNPKVGMAVSAAAGPVSNLLLAWLSMVLYRVGYWFGWQQTLPAAVMFLYYMVVMNLSLAAFNLMPLPPFDGSRVVLLFLPQRLYFRVMQYERYIMLAMLFLTFTGLLDRPLAAVVNFLWGGLVDATNFVDTIGGYFARGINV